MHQVKYSYRRILPSEIPTVTPIGETERPANDAELLNMGIVRISSDIFSCVHQEERNPDTLEWAPKDGQVLPGTVLSQGSFKERHASLPADARDEITQARAVVALEARRVAGRLVSGGPGKPDIVDEPPADPEPIDFSALHSWAGENKH